MTQAILKVVGKSRAPLAMNIAGYIVSIPVFCDSGYVILNPLNKALAKESGTSMAVMAVALSTGLYATHTMVPPTPGPYRCGKCARCRFGEGHSSGLDCCHSGGALWSSLGNKSREKVRD